MSTWTADKIQALGPTTDLPTLGSIFDCSRWKAYQMARTGEWETVGVKIVRLGSRYRVVVPSILDVLGYADGASAHVGPHKTAHPGTNDPYSQSSA